jgi:hypothetical protein
MIQRCAGIHYVSSRIFRIGQVEYLRSECSGVMDFRSIEAAAQRRPSIRLQPRVRARSSYVMNSIDRPLSPHRFRPNPAFERTRQTPDAAIAQLANAFNTALQTDAPRVVRP